tara:strand:- start:17414 stop:18505 length:1092 start_codon:yes stop_codon:yes gene_type:complete
MNSKINNYLILNYSKVLFNGVLISFCLGLILNLFEEVEFFKNSGESLFLPLILTLSYIPNLIFINLMPFIIFISAMWFFISIKQNNELLTLKVFGYSNAKIIALIGSISFLWGLIVLIIINPVTADMVKYYEKTKSNYSKDTDHLVTINRNGVWIKESKGENLYIINADRLENNNLINVSINVMTNKNIISQRIEAEKADISSNNWEIQSPKIFSFDEKGNINIKKSENIKFISFYNVEKLNNLFKNLDTISFFELFTESEKLITRGYEKTIISEKINSFFALPFFLALMTVLAAIFTINKRNSNNINYLMIAVLTCAVIYYMKDLSVALGKSDRISPEISVWIPIIIIGLINSIGLLQINEK